MEHKLTDSVTNALQVAFAEAQKRRQTEVTDNHLLWAFLKEKEGYFNSILSGLQTNVGVLLSEVDDYLDHLPTFSTETVQPPNPARSLQSRIADAQNIAQSWKDEYTVSDHFFAFVLEKWRRSFRQVEENDARFSFSSRRTN